MALHPWGDHLPDRGGAAGLNPGEGIEPDDPRAYPNRPVWQRLATIFAGPGINYLFAALLLIALNLAVGVPVGIGAMVKEITVGKPAAQAGILPGDEIVSINGTKVTAYSQVAPAVESSAGKPLAIEVLRDKQHKTLTVTPVKDSGHWRIGIGLRPKDERKHLGAWLAVEDGLKQPVMLTWATIQSFIEAAHHRQSLEVGSVVQIVRVMKQQIGLGWVRGVEIVAIISTMLGFFNLLPVPALDGGRLVFLGWEVLTRRPVNPRVEQWVHAAGMVVLLCLIGILVVKDVRNIITGG